VDEKSLRLRPVVEDDLIMIRRFAVEPDLMGLDWNGFRDAAAPARRFAIDGYLSTDNSRLMIEVESGEAVGFIDWTAGTFVRERHWEIGIVLLPEWRGRGIGSRAQVLLCDYLFSHTSVQRIQAGTHPENVAEQKALEKAGFKLDGVIRATDFRDGQWRDVWMYSRLRSDPPPSR
jgi:[ribosomal protein S5]-alanine N-acetyltransferase